MPGPWEKYAKTPEASPSAGPWGKYSVPTPSSDVSKIESFARGGAQGVTMGFADEISGGAQAGWQEIKDYLMGQDDGKSFIDNYREARDKSRKEFKEAQEANPITYGAGGLAGGVATTAVSGPTAGLAKLAALGALSGFGGSDADLTEGDVLDVAKDTAVGAGVGFGIGAAGKGLAAGGRSLMEKMAPVRALRELAQGRGAAALGYTKRLLNTAEKRAGAHRTAQEMLDEGVITPFASPQQMSERVGDLVESSGQKIGDFLRARGTGFDTQDAVEAINSIRPKDANGQWLTGGQYDRVHQMLDNAIETIRAHGDVIPFEEANKLKGFLQSMVNWNSTKLEGDIGKGIAGGMREAVDTSLERAAAGKSPTGAMAFQGHSPEEGKALLDDFLANKATYRAGMEATDALANRLSSEGGNKTFGLTDAIWGAGELAAGNPAGAVAAVAGKKTLERFGNQTIASLANKGANIAESLGEFVKTNPQALGRYAGVLQNAVGRGQQALASTHFLLMEKDQEYRDMIGQLEDGRGDER